MVGGPLADNEVAGCAGAVGRLGVPYRGGVPNLGGLPNEPWSAAARADCPGPLVLIDASAPASGVWVPWVACSDVRRTAGVLAGPVEAAGDKARRAIEVAREAGPAAGDRPRELLGDGELGTGRGFEGCPDIAVGVRAEYRPSR